MIQNIANWVSANKEWFLSGLGIAVFSLVVSAIKFLIPAIFGKSGGEFHGKWRIQLDGEPDGTCNGKMTLSHIGPYVWGRAELFGHIENGRQITSEYAYKGRYQREQAILRYSELVNDKRIVGATVLRLGAKRKMVFGCNAYWHHGSDTMTSQMFSLHPIGDR